MILKKAEISSSLGYNSLMKIGIIGQGAGGIFTAIALKKENPLLDIYLIDQNKIFGKKLLATGNGRCNLANSVSELKHYNSKDTLRIYASFQSNAQVAFWKDLGILTREINGLVYPYSLSAKNFVETLYSLVQTYKINLLNEVTVIDYKAKDVIKVKTNWKSFDFDKLIISCGGRSQKNLGSDGSLFSLLKKKGYDIAYLKPGLCPLKLKEETITIENERLKCKISLEIDSKIHYIEEGEVIFKNKGIGGICILNASSVLNRLEKYSQANLYLDLIPFLPLEIIKEEFIRLNKTSKFSFLNGIFTKRISEYIYKRCDLKGKTQFSEDDVIKIATLVKHFPFEITETFGFDQSQVTIGGIKYSNLTSNLESTREKGVFFVGEVLDGDGLCGGYNLMFAFASAHLVTNYLLKKAL